ncbi:hypothetical protein JM946_13485 [Steroidobacter sp. S1-65]|uniref:Uncharacterized protein n=1 Tax=Steroidobacter gossypii TaxID=2805490 RepID=A0ABS1WXR0_9GAMM|nr:hypothetical protein [Steroidobacter gossypii]MBM0105748.1 hypothetical protein [Steroidobacter gossypii]
MPLDPQSNPELVKQTFLARLPPRYRDQTWQMEEARLQKLARDGVLRLSRADLRGLGQELRGGVQLVYRLEHAGDPSEAGQDQPRLMFIPAESTAPELLSSLANDSVGDIWVFDDELFLVRYAPARKHIHRVFVVSELTRPRLGPGAPIGATERCTLQYKNDRQQRK